MLTLRVVSGIFFLVGLVTGVVGFVYSRDGFGYRGMLAYAGIGVLSRVLVFELAEIIRWLRKLVEKYSSEWDLALAANPLKKTKRKA